MQEKKVDNADCEKQPEQETSQADITELMKRGYVEMSEINLALAEDALLTDNQLWSDILD